MCVRCSGYRSNKVCVVRHHTRWLSVFTIHVQVCHIRKSDSEAGNDYDARTHDFFFHIHRQETCDLRWCSVFWFLNTWRWASNQSCDRFYRYPDYCAQMNEFFFHRLSFYIFSIETDHIARYGKMSERAARQKFWQILSAVEYCHNRGIVHRDLKVMLKLERDRESNSIISINFTNSSRQCRAQCDRYITSIRKHCVVKFDICLIVIR